jgi:hypothetical protein
MAVGGAALAPDLWVVSLAINSAMEVGAAGAVLAPCSHGMVSSSSVVSPSSGFTIFERIVVGGVWRAIL